MADFAYRTIEELGTMLRNGETSPTELARAAIERLDTVGRDLNSVVTITEERAMREARLAEDELAAGLDRGPLHGIPYGVKDLLATADYPTSWGAEPYRDQQFPYDAGVVEKLRDAGAVLVAKLAMIELAGGAGYEQPNASFTGPCKTPWNTDAWSGGSSAGSGAAVAAGCVPFAIGSETQGSIHSPASNCGVSGLRPTYGRVTRRGAMALSWTMDKIGPLARTAHDCGLVLNAIAGYDVADPSSLHRDFRYPDAGLPSRNLRFGVLEQELEGAQPEVVQAFNESLNILTEFGTVEPVQLPDFPYASASAIIIRSEMGAAFEEDIRSGKLMDLTAPEDRINPFAALAVPAVDYLRAMRIRQQICDGLDELLGQFDALLSPTKPTVATAITERFDAFDSARARRTMAAAVNLAGTPGIAVPNGFGERGLPTSLCVTTRLFDENIALAIARAYQEQTDWHTHTPDL